MFPGWLLCVFYWSKTYLVSAANLATVFMMLNRWSSIANPLTHRKVIKFRKYLKIIFLALESDCHICCFTDSRHTINLHWTHVW